MQRQQFLRQKGLMPADSQDAQGVARFLLGVALGIVRCAVFLG